MPFFCVNKEAAMQRSLPAKIWLPFGSLESYYWLYYLVQVFCAVTATSIAVGCDLLFAGLILNTCLKIDLLVKYLQNLSDITNLSKSNRVMYKNYKTQKKYVIENRLISEIVQEHQLIFK